MSVISEITRHKTQDIRSKTQDHFWTRLFLQKISGFLAQKRDFLRSIGRSRNYLQNLPRNDLNIMEKVTDPDDPRRCQGVCASGQCPHKAEPESHFCAMHGGKKSQEAINKKEMKNYRLTKYRDRVTDLSNNANLASLRDEVAILRMIIEEKVNACQDTQQLLLVSGPLSDLVMKCGVLVEKCNRLESRLGNFLDRNKITQFAQICIEIISQFVPPENLEQAGEQIFKALGEV